jgi:hypothetical protein
MSLKLWIGAGTLFVTAFVGKQLLWQKVSKEVGSLREEEHKKSVEHYESIIVKREKYVLPPMTEEEKSALKKHFEKYNSNNK